ncbi:unnamed protein product [Porites evermanni]|uniref:Uncharacterized protein n=1 Tax=Porites evermanni TaxID=104178 RepID=A0ABN8RPM4_9CNID|nr:unnamed protein product [Porites evermanni]
MEGSSQLLSTPVSINNQSLAVTNSTAAVAITASVYVFTPVGFDTKLVLLVLLIAFGVIGLVGNILVVYFVRKKQSSSILQLSPFLRNFNLYVKTTMNGIRYDINATHYTVDCKYDTSYLPYRAIVVGYIQVQHVIPSIALICINIILARRVWKWRKRRIDVQKDNAIKGDNEMAASQNNFYIDNYHLSFCYSLFIITLLRSLSCGSQAFN